MKLSDIVSEPLLLFLLALCTLVSGYEEEELCETVHSRCVHQHSGCAHALIQYSMNCMSNSTHGTSSQTCNKPCLYALIALLTTSSDSNSNFMTCDCQSSEVCIRHRSRMLECQVQVEQQTVYVNDDTTPISCHLAGLVCQADTSCGTALMYYEDRCHLMMMGEHCTHGCNNSLNILYQQEKATKLKDCYCEDPEKDKCDQVRGNIQRLCGQRLLLPSTVSVSTTQSRLPETDRPARTVQVEPPCDNEVWLCRGSLHTVHSMVVLSLITVALVLR